VSAREPIKVTIFHNTYTLISQGDSSELVQVAREVDDLMHSIAEKSGSADPSRVAVLACLHLADRLRRLETINNDVTHRAEHFSALLEQVLSV
jgi:cell division protein ZapA